MRGGGRPVAWAVLWLLPLLITVNAYAGVSPWRMGGNLEYNYRQTDTQPGNTSSYDHRFLGALDINGYLGQPWVATTDAGGTVSVGQIRSSSGQRSDADLLTGRFNFNLFPSSHFPASFTYQASNNVIDWVNTQQSSALTLNDRYRSSYMSLRQGLIAPQGDRADVFYQVNDRSTDKKDFGRYTDKTLGLKTQLRGEGVNFYATGTQLMGSQSATGDTQTSTNGVANLGIFPGSDFYLNTLGTLVSTSRKDGAARPSGTVAPSNGSFASNADTSIQQVASYFYWRPEYKAYAMTGGARLHRRNAVFAEQLTELTQLNSTASVEQQLIKADIVNEQYDVAANLAADYQFTMRTRMYVAADFSSANTLTTCNYQPSPYQISVLGCTDSANNSWGGTGSGAVIHQSDKYVYNGIGWYWYADGNTSAKLLTQYEARDWSGATSGGITHTGYYNWVTGNRGTLRVTATQGARQFLTYSSADSNRMNVAHTLSMTWNNNDEGVNSFLQALVTDNHELGLDRNSQLINLQYSSTYAISRVSNFGGHVSAQSARRYDTLGSTGFLTTASGRLSYQHARVFGIYRLRFNARGDLSLVEVQYGGARRQFDWQNDLDYNIGRLSTALMYRMLYNEGAQNTQMLLLKVSRNF